VTLTKIRRTEFRRQSYIDELVQYDTIIFGSPTSFGNIAVPMKALWDRTIGLWSHGSLIGKVGAGFTSASSVHGCQKQQQSQ
jgi:NAD(P)H dehydrogenase (quinone)